VLVEHGAYLSGAVGIHQFCRIGRYAMVGGQAHITKDVPPFVTVDGASSLIVGLNIVGLRRAGFQRADIDQLKAAYRVVFRQGLRWNETLAVLRESFPAGHAAVLAEFLENTKRGCVQERRLPRSATLKLHVVGDEDGQDAASRRRAS
jgi:UDP-N-acetylglucosamine acyltransferase